MMKDDLKSNSQDIERLSKLIASKTHGNPFHAIQFVETIQREELLSYNAEKDMWEYDVDEIQRDMMVSDTLADLLQKKIQRLPKEVQEVLKVASMLGF